VAALEIFKREADEATNLAQRSPMAGIKPVPVIAVTQGSVSAAACRLRWAPIFGSAPRIAASR
jgi:hypothetical protein